MSKISRRDFVKATMAAAGAAVVGSSFGPFVSSYFSKVEI